MVLVDENTNKVKEIYELKPKNFYGMQRGHEQLAAYEKGFLKQKYSEAPKRGTAFNPNGL